MSCTLFIGHSNLVRHTLGKESQGSPAADSLYLLLPHLTLWVSVSLSKVERHGSSLVV